MLPKLHLRKQKVRHGQLRPVSCIDPLTGDAFLPRGLLSHVLGKIGEGDDVITIAPLLA
jgi:hypothetical protein